jgi:predicted nuclease of predicted toxin-antitoxin system
MRFLADECCDFSAVRILRAHGHDVLAVSEFQRRSVDKDLMELALAENRILLTEDKDFGWLAFARRMDSPGVILIRFPASARSVLPGAVLKLVDEHASRLVGAFVVLRPGTARISFPTQHPG